MKLKNRKIHKVLLLPLLMTVMLLPMQVFAAEYQCSLDIPVEVQVTGSSIPSGNEYTVIIEKTKEDPDVPMPEVTEITIKDGGTLKFGTITYTRPDDYLYRIYQKKGNTPNFTYDETVYTVTVRVLNDENGGLRWEMWAVRDDSDKKTQEIRFENHYSKPSDPEEEDHGNDPGDDPGQDEESSVVPVVVKKTEPVPPVPVVVPGQEAGSSQAGGSQTGDSAAPALWGVLVAISVFALTTILMKRKKNENTEE